MMRRRRRFVSSSFRSHLEGTDEFRFQDDEDKPKIEEVDDEAKPKKTHTVKETVSLSSFFFPSLLTFSAGHRASRAQQNQASMDT